MPKCGLCHFGAKRAPTAPLERLGAFGPLRTPKNVVHVCQNAKVTFCNFLFFENIKIKLQKSTFTLLHTCPTFLGVLRGPNAPSRSSGAVGALFAPKSHKPHFGIRVRRFLMFLGSQNACLRSKRVLAPLLHFGTPKPSRNVDHV